MMFLLHAGTYRGAWKLRNSGEPGRPIVWCAAGDGVVVLELGTMDQAVLDSKTWENCGTPGWDDAPARTLLSSGALVDADKIHDVWFENLSFRGSANLLRVHGAARLVIRGCHFSQAICGVVGAGDPLNPSRLLVVDNTFQGMMPWPTDHAKWKALPESRAIWVNGIGNVFAYNRLKNWKPRH